MRFESEMARLAIIGAGVGGCCTAYFARKQLPSMDITIFDSQERIGGRVLTRQIDGVNFELGASFFNGFNRTLASIVRDQRMKVISGKERLNFAIWNGSEIIFRPRKNSLAISASLLARYGLSVFKTILLLRKVRHQFARMYGEEFKRPRDMNELMKVSGLNEWFGKTFREVLLKKGISRAFTDEVLTPIIRAIYSQNSDLGGLAGISSLIEVYSGATYSLADGNETLPTSLAKSSKAKVKLGQKVDVIEKASTGKYNVYCGENVTEFDSVIIASPLELSGIRLEGVSSPSSAPQSFQPVYKKIIRGAFNKDYFGLKASAEAPELMLTTEEVGPVTQFDIKKGDRKDSLVTITSTQPLKVGMFDDLFNGECIPVLEHSWSSAYPRFQPTRELPPSRIDNGLIYSGAMELIVSSMETSALSALNAVRILEGEKLFA